MPRRSTKKQYKGGDASTYAAAVYGSSNQQHAVSGSNVIAMNPVTCNQMGGGPPPMPRGAIGASTGTHRGGKKQDKQGGNALTEIAVPAILITANQLYKKRSPSKTSKKYRGKRYRKSRRTFSKRR